MHVFVTGGGGFCGSHLVAALSSAGHRVTAHMGRGKGPVKISEGIETVVGDLADGVRIPTGTDAVIHTAAQSPGPGIAISEQEYARSNILATERLAAAAEAAGVGRFVFFSSISVYGRIEVDALDESTPIIDPDVYGRSKRMGELAVTERGFASLSIRLPGVIGPRSVRNWLSTMIACSRGGRDVTYFNASALYNNAVHIADLTDFVLGLLNRGWQGHDVVVLGADEPIPVREMVEFILAAGGNVAHGVAVSHGKPPFLLSCARAKGRYGYRPMTMRSMLARFVRENGLRL